MEYWQIKTYLYFILRKKIFIIITHFYRNKTFAISGPYLINNPPMIQWSTCTMYLMYYDCTSTYIMYVSMYLGYISLFSFFKVEKQTHYSYWYWLVLLTGRGRGWQVGPGWKLWLYNPGWEVVAFFYTFSC
jgi:hypothetical protein